MKKCLILFFISLSFCTYSIEYNTYQMEVEHIFKASQRGEDNATDLGVNNFPGSGSLAVGPGIFFEDSKLVILDQVNKQMRTIYINDDFSFSKIYEESFYNSNIIFYNNVILGYNNDFVSALNKNSLGHFKFDITTYDFKIFRNYKDLYFQDNTLFIFDKDYKIWAIKNPGLYADENKKNIVSENEIIQEINSGKYQGLSIDSEKRLFYQGEYKTLLYKKYVNYLSTLRSGNAGSIKGFNYDYITLAKFKMETYIGSDLDGNKYWCSSRTVIVISSNGLLKDIFRYDDDLSDTYPAVSPEGDVYFMNYGVDNVTLYKVERKW